jgi:hypothetical protein
MQEILLTASANSLLFWVNAFVWTFRQKAVGENGEEHPVSGLAANVPFITWPVQDEVMTLLAETITKGGDLNIEKSRDMGTSWLILTVFDWFFIFQKSATFGLVSRKEALVDAKGDMDSLFEKIRYIHRMLPEWMMPGVQDRYMYLRNAETGSTLAGESTNQDVGRGGRKVAYLVDEGAAVPNGLEVESALSQNTACQIWASTPHGPNTAFHKRVLEHRGRLVQMPWWRHPEKARGAHEILSPDGKVRWTSPWYEKLSERLSRKTIAQEVDMDHGSSGDLFFDYTELERHRQDHMRPPIFAGELIPVKEMASNAWVQMLQANRTDAFAFLRDHGRKPWKFWVPLTDGRPPQELSYVFGIDISNGSGNSNSVLTVFSPTVSMVVAKFWDAYTSPEDFALVAAAAGMWFGGLKPPAFMCWENNGPGGIFGRKIISIGYPSFYRQWIDNSLKNERTPRWGWNSNRERKEVMLGMYRDALSRDAFINPCSESLTEAADYIYTNDGGLVPSTIRDEPFGGRELHGDHVIADGLAFLASSEVGRIGSIPARAPAGTFEYRKRMAKSLGRKDDPWRLR